MRPVVNRPGEMIVAFRPEMIRRAGIRGYAIEALQVLAMLRSDYGAVMQTLWPVGVAVLKPQPVAPAPALPGGLEPFLATATVATKVNERLAGLEWLGPEILEEARLRLHVVIADPQKVDEAVAKAMAFVKAVEWAEPIAAVKAPEVVSRPGPFPDPMDGGMHTMKVTTPSGYWPRNSLDFNRPEDWDRVALTNIAVLDSGCDPKHPSLSGRIGFGTTASKTDTYGHGTFVCGVIAATYQRFESGYWVPPGVFPAARIWTMKIFDNKHELVSGLYSLGLRLLADATRPGDPIVTGKPKGIQVVNLSIHSDKKAIYESADLKKLQDNGILVVASAGNAVSNGAMAPIVYPAANPWCISVGAIESGLTTRWKRSCQLSAGTTRNPVVNLYAPGVSVLSAAPTTGTPKLGRRCANLDGTSMAAPFVTALAAYLRSMGVPDRAAVVNALQTKGEKIADWYRLRWQ